MERREDMSRVCKKCGGAAQPEDRFCMHCGMPLEKESPSREEQMDAQQAEIVSMGEYLLMLILLAIPVVNLIVCLFWLIRIGENPNKRNFAKAWLLFAIIGTVLSGILAFGAFHFLARIPIMEHEYHMEYRIPEEQFLREAPWDEI